MWEQIASFVGPVALAGMVWVVKKVHSHDSLIAVLTAEAEKRESQALERHREVREDMRDVKETLDGLTRYLLQPPGR